MLRLAVILAVAGLSGAGFAGASFTGAAAIAAAGAAPEKAPILYVQGISCPARKSCTGQPAYYERIREIPAVGLPSRPLSNGSFSDTEPAWSPDHRQIAFVRESRNGLSYSIWVMRADGSGARPVTHGNVVDVEPTWSPDGKRIAFRGDSADGRSFDLYTVRVDGSGRKDLTSDADDVSVTDPSWSTNNLIAFERTRQNAGAGTGIYTIRPDGSGLRRLCIGGFDPAWSPGGHRIAFVLPGPRGGVLEIATMSPNGTGRTFLTGGTESTAPAWSPDGSRIVFLRDTQITVMNADGSHIKQVTRPLHGANFVDTPAW